MKTIVVIGAGPSGMLAAGQAARAGARVILLEKMEGPGKKLRLCGKGRCNLTNNTDIHGMLNHFNANGRFLHQAFARFHVAELMAFFEELGVPLVTERGRRVFPKSGKSADVVAALAGWLTTSSATFLCEQRVTRLLISDNRVTGVESNGKKLHSDGVILATGGVSYPATGSTGDGYTLARQAGHRITPLRPALIPLITRDIGLRRLAGLDLKNVGLRIFVDGKRKVNDFGEVGFASFGLCGPLTLTHSRQVVDWLAAGKTVTARLDLKPALDERQLDARLQREFAARGTEQLASVLRALLPRQLIEICLERVGMSGVKPARETTAAERQRLKQILKDFRLEVQGSRPLDEAIVTAGGVDVREVDPRTMESKLVRGLYFCGELLDIDGDTGGYNLQAAFSTGWLAGRSAASREET